VRTLAQFEEELAQGRLSLGPQSVVLLDQADRLGVAGMDALLGWIEGSGARVVVASSAAGQGGMDAGAPMRLIAERVSPSHLASSMRQHGQSDRLAVDALATDAADAVAARLLDAGQVIAVPRPVSGQMQAIAEAFVADPSADKLALVTSAAVAQELNLAIREVLRRGKRDEQAFAHGEVPIALAVGDHIVFTASDRSLGVMAGDRAIVTGVARGVTVALGAAGAAPREIALRDLRDVTYGWALPIHAAPETGVGSVHVLAGAGLDRGAALRAFSRHEDVLKLYVPRPEAEAAGYLSGLLGRSRPALNALDLVGDASRAAEAAATAAVGQASMVPPPRSAPAAVEALPELLARPGIRGAERRATRVETSADPHLVGVAERWASRLARTYIDGQPAIAEGSDAFAEAPRLVVEDLLARRAVIAAEDVARALARGIRDPRIFVPAFYDAMAHPDLVVVSDGMASGQSSRPGRERLYSTAAQLRAELTLSEGAAALARREGFSSVGYRPNRYRLTEEQHSALAHVMCGQALTVLTGGPASGLTHTLGAVQDAYVRAGYEVICVAPTRSGAAALERVTGLRGMTLQAFAGRVSRDRIVLGPKSVVVLDGAERLDVAALTNLIGMIDAADARLVLAGADTGIGSIGGIDALGVVAARVGAAEIRTAARQRDPAERAAATGLALGARTARAAMAWHLEAGHVVAVEDGADAAGAAAAIAALAECFARDLASNRIALAHSRADVGRLNLAIRDAVAARMGAELRGEERQYLTEPDVVGTRLALAAGDRIILHAGVWAQGIAAGTTGEVLQVSETALVVQTGQGGARQIHRIGVVELAEAGLDYGWAATVHAAPSDGVMSAHVLVTPGMDRGVLARALSRHSESVRLYVPRPEALAGAYLAEIVSRETGPRSALDLLREDVRAEPVAVAAAGPRDAPLPRAEEVVPAEGPGDAQVARISADLVPATPLRALADRKPRHPRVDLVIPFAEKQQASDAGARWDAEKKVWYAPEGIDLRATGLKRWAPPKAADPTGADVPRSSRVNLAVPFEDRDAAKAAGARWDAQNKVWYAPEGRDLAASGLGKWLGTASGQRPAMAVAGAGANPDDLFFNEMWAMGLRPTGAPAADGRLHRVPVEGDRGAERSGAYTYHRDGGVPAGFIQNFKTGQQITWSAPAEALGRPVSDEERALLAKQVADAQMEREAVRAETQAAARAAALALWQEAPPAPASNAYLAKKGIEDPAASQLRIVPSAVSEEARAAGVRVARSGSEAQHLRENEPDAWVFRAGDLLVPLYDEAREIAALQTINPDFKGFMRGARKSRLYAVAGGTAGSIAEALAADATMPVVIAEGFATADAVAAGLRQPVIAALDAGNLDAVAAHLRAAWPDRRIVIAADNDRHPDDPTRPNVGLQKAQAAAAAHGAAVVAPAFDEADGKASDWNDFQALHGREETARVLRAALDLPPRAEQPLEGATVVPRAPREIVQADIQADLHWRRAAETARNEALNEIQTAHRVAWHRRDQIDREIADQQRAALAEAMVARRFPASWAKLALPDGDFPQPSRSVRLAHAVRDEIQPELDRIAAARAREREAVERDIITPQDRQNGRMDELVDRRTYAILKAREPDLAVGIESLRERLRTVADELYTPGGAASLEQRIGWKTTQDLQQWSETDDVAIAAYWYAAPRRLIKTWRREIDAQKVTLKQEEAAQEQVRLAFHRDVPQIRAAEPPKEDAAAHAAWAEHLEAYMKENRAFWDASRERTDAVHARIAELEKLSQGHGLQEAMLEQHPAIGPRVPAILKREGQRVRAMSDAQVARQIEADRKAAAEKQRDLGRYDDLPLSQGQSIDRSRGIDGPGADD
jgi:phage/plasmid primase-like uncharacterized protein